MMLMMTAATEGEDYNENDEIIRQQTLLLVVVDDMKETN